MVVHIIIEDFPLTIYSFNGYQRTSSASTSPRIMSININISKIILTCSSRSGSNSNNLSIRAQNFQFMNKTLTVLTFNNSLFHLYLITIHSEPQVLRDAKALKNKIKWGKDMMHPYSRALSNNYQCFEFFLLNQNLTLHK